MTGIATGVSAGVIDRLGVRLHPAGPGADPRVLLGLALRRNPRRAQLLVSRVLGKHVPTDPRLVRAAGLLLGGLVADALAGRPARPLPVPLLHAAVRRRSAPRPAPCTRRRRPRSGSRPTRWCSGSPRPPRRSATASPRGWAAPTYLHSTRRPVAGFTTAGGFTEEHSHATDHLLLPAEAGLLRGGRPLVLVDDELSTGRTALNTIAALHRAAPREHYVVAALVDVRPPGGALAAGVAALGARLDVVALARGAVDLPPDIAERAAALRAELDADPDSDALRARLAVHRERDSRASRPRLAGGAAGAGVACGTAGRGTARVRRGGAPRARGGAARARRRARAGCRAAPRGADARAGHRGADAAAAAAGPDPGRRRSRRRVLHHHPLPRRWSWTSPATRSRSGITFPAHDDPADGPGPRFAYNVGAAEPWDHVVVVVDPPADTPALRTGLLPALAPYTRRTTLVVTP